MSQLSPATADYVLSAKAGIESLEYIDDLLREYLLFRGFTSTLQAFESDLEQDRDQGFHADKIVDELLSMARELRVDSLQEYWKYLSFRFFSHLSPKYQRTTKMFEKRLLRLFLVSAAKAGRRHDIRTFMGRHGTELGQQSDWIPWLGLEYIDQPHERPEFEAYFADEWAASLRAALADFMQTVFPAMAVPRILLFDKDRREREALQRKLHIFEEHMRGETKITAHEVGDGSGPVGLVEDHIGPAVVSPRLLPALSTSGRPAELDHTTEPVHTSEPDRAAVHVVPTDEPSSVLRISQEDIFLEHNAGISMAKFSASGELIASYDDESVLRVWAPDPSSTQPKLKNELDFAVTAMAWDRRHTHLLYLYDESGFIHTLNTKSNLLGRHPVFDRRHPWLQCMLPSAASSTLLTVCSAKPESSSDVAVLLWDAAASRTVASRRLPASPDAHGVCAALNHNATLAALAYSSGHIRLIDARSLETVATINTAQRDVCAVELSRDEDSLVVVTESGALTRWSLRKSHELLAESSLDIGASALPDSRLDCDRVAFTPDRDCIVVAPRDQCFIFNIDSASLSDCTRRHKDLISVIDMAADRMLSASEDGTVRVAQYRKV
ncbi:hypothetical protein IW142_000535 [Coemansia sp. RSA 564]|nr:hypothetical protein IW142_000535 [Coemansia sp. RSA 564]KAJ2410126.1 hypothetical protein J3F80_000796 [Coemansia sp. RSA 2526]